MQNNNLFNGNLFQQTPQKNTGWTVPGAGTGANNGSTGGTTLGNNGSIIQTGNISGFPMGNGLQTNQAPGGLFSAANSSNNNVYNRPDTVGQFTQGNLFNGQTGNAFSPSNSASSTFNQPYNSQFSGTWGAPTAGITSKGSKVAPYTRTKIKEDTGFETECVDITAMKEYSNTCTDIIRSEDYEMMRKPTPKYGTGSTSGNTLGSSSGYSTVSNMFNKTGTTGTSSITTPGTATSGISLGSSFSTPSMGNNLNLSGNLFGGAGTNSFGGSLTGNVQQCNTQPIALQPNNTMQGLNTSSVFPSNTSLVTNPPLSSSLGNNQFNIQPASTNLGSSLFSPTGASNNFMAPGATAGLSGSASINNNLFNNAKTGGLFGGSTSLFGNPTNIQTNAMPSLSTMPGVSHNPFNTVSSFSNPVFSSSAVAPAFSPVNFSDPFLIKELEFEKAEAQKLPVKAILPTPIFDTKKPTFMAPILFRPPRKIHNTGIATIPEIGDGAVNVPNLTIKFAGTGKIEYLEPVTVDSVGSIEKRIKFRNDAVEMADEPGTGLNKRARVYVEGVFPYSRSSNSFIKGTPTDLLSKSVQDRFLYHLKNDAVKKFVDYDVESGLYIYEVNHF
ncbi:hypothetical protein PAEPH01_1554 [Pancytospora epiphaga]|nr:hypothetical protein PAEPH01_1554 [Pancytospora epiphaga]